MLTRNIGPKVVCKGAGAVAVLLLRSRIQFAVLRARSLVVTTAIQPEPPLQPQTRMGKKARHRLQKRAWRLQESEQLLQQADERHLETLGELLGRNLVIMMACPWFHSDGYPIVANDLSTCKRTCVYH